MPPTRKINRQPSGPGGEVAGQCGDNTAERGAGIDKGDGAGALVAGHGLGGERDHDRQARPKSGSGEKARAQQHVEILCMAGKERKQAEQSGREHQNMFAANAVCQPSSQHRAGQQPERANGKYQPQRCFGNMQCNAHA